MITCGSAAGLAPTRKAGFTGSRDEESRGIERERGPEVLFEGSAREAIRQFPKNVNSAVTLGRAGIGVVQTRATVVMDPALEHNEHHIMARGAFGELEFRVRLKPMPGNPKTSYLTGLSVLALLQQLQRRIRIGG
ncbi:MAG: DUF108 domain-containing protein [Alicyclobacillus sp.]|nr:DUF108 domain-containing protein [Alicyclobacillus sp.]